VHLDLAEDFSGHVLLNHVDPEILHRRDERSGNNGLKMLADFHRERIAETS